MYLKDCTKMDARIELRVRHPQLGKLDKIRKILNEKAVDQDFWVREKQRKKGVNLAETYQYVGQKYPKAGQYT